MRILAMLLLIACCAAAQPAASPPGPTKAPTSRLHMVSHGEVAVRAPKESYVGLPAFPGFAGASAAGLTDPATAQIPGCAYEAKSKYRPGPAMVCRVCGGETVIRGLDFTRHGSVWLFVSVPAACPTSIVTRLVVADSRFAGGPTVDVPNGDLVHIVATGRILDRTFADDTFDGRFAPSKPGTMEALQVDAYNGNETWLRDAFINIPGRPVSDGFGQAASLGHNVFLAEALYLSGMTLAASGDHGELFEFGKSRPGAVPVQMTYRHNVLIAPAAPASNTALLWLGSGDHSGPLDIETLTLDGNVLIAEPYGKKGTTSRIIGMAYAKIARLVAVHNAIWPRGASYCILNEKGDVMRASFKDNINLFNGSKISGFDGYAGTCPGTRR